jgi:hypothetical protein
LLCWYPFQYSKVNWSPISFYIFLHIFYIWKQKPMPFTKRWRLNRVKIQIKVIILIAVKQSRILKVIYEQNNNKEVPRIIHVYLAFRLIELGKWNLVWRYICN